MKISVSALTQRIEELVLPDLELRIANVQCELMEFDWFAVAWGLHAELSVALDKRDKKTAEKVIDKLDRIDREYNLKRTLGKLKESHEEAKNFLRVLALAGDDTLNYNPRAGYGSESALIRKVVDYKTLAETSAAMPFDDEDDDF